MGATMTPASTGTTTTTLPGGGTVGGVGWTPDTSKLPQAGGTPQPATLPNEMLGGQSFDSRTTDAEGNVLGGPGLWQVPTAGGGMATFNDEVKKLYALSPAQLQELQIQLYQAGYYDDSIYKQHANPSWQVADNATQQAYYAYLLDRARHPDQDPRSTLQVAMDRNRDRLTRLQTGGELVDLRPGVITLSNIATSDPATLRLIANAASQALTGKDMTDEERQRFSENITGQQAAQGRRRQAEEIQAANARAAEERRAAEATAQGPKPANEELAAFKQVVANEIVGPLAAFAPQQSFGSGSTRVNEYGIDADTIAKWADEARRDGVAVPALNSPQAVDLVVDHHLQRLYAATGGDWNSVATYFAADIDAAMKRSRGVQPLGRGTAGPTPGMEGRTTGVGARRAQTTPGSTNSFDAQGRLVHGQEGSLPPTAPPSIPDYGRDTLGRPITSVQVRPEGATDLAPIASHITGSMAQILGRSAGTAPTGVQGNNNPIFVGGATEAAIDPQAQAQEAIKREHPQDVFEHSMMSALDVLESMVRSGRG